MQWKHNWGNLTNLMGREYFSGSDVKTLPRRMI